MLTATFLPGATYSAGVFTIPWTALNTAVVTDALATDSVEMLTYMLLELVKEKQDAGTITQPNCSMEVSQKSLSMNGVWETATNTFSTKSLCSFLVTFPIDTATFEGGNDITGV
jgi:hypothetical protein